MGVGLVGPLLLLIIWLFLISGCSGLESSWPLKATAAAAAAAAAAARNWKASIEARGRFSPSFVLVVQSLETDFLPSI